MTHIGIILLNFDNVHETEPCIESLLQSEFRDFEIIVVDNGSTPPVKAQLSPRFPDVIYLRTEINLGFTGGCNIGIRRALEDSCATILLLNNDTYVPPKMLGTLVGEMERLHADIVCPKILYFDPPHHVWFGGGSYNPVTATATHIGIGQPDDGRWDTATQCEFVSGCSLLARRQVYEEIGLLDEKLFTYFDDSDFCMRARLKGRTVWYTPAAVLYHKVTQTMKWDSPWYLYFHCRNRWFLIRRYAGTQTVLGMLSFAYYAIRQLIRMMIKYRDPSGTRAVLWGVSDGLRKFIGEHGEGRLPLILKLSSQHPRAHRAR